MNKFKFEITNINENIKELIGLPYETYKKYNATKIAMLKDENTNEILSYVSLYLKDIEKIDNKPTGYIGYIYSSSKETEETLLKNTLDWCKNNGINILIGPIEKNTWNEYRYKVTNDYNFIGEPSQSLSPNLFEKYGFKPEYKYYSYLHDFKNPKMIFVKTKKNIKFRYVTDESFDKDIKEIYKLCMKSFKNNLFFGYISEEDFIAKYKRFYDTFYVDILLVTENEKIIGFILGYWGPKVDNQKTYIMKTIAVDPEYRGEGLSTNLYEKLLIDQIGDNEEIKIIGALVYERNISKNLIKNHDYKEICKYYLYRLDF